MRKLPPLSPQGDIKGMRFGQLVAIELTGNNLRGNKIWLLQCDCGNITTGIASGLKRGDKISCGCAKKARIGNFNKLPEGQSSINRLFHNYNVGARRRNLVFELTKELFCEIILLNCHYCGIVPSTSSAPIIKTSNGSITYNGIDRKEPSIGYTLENVVPCCKNCNYAKSNMTYLEFYDYINRLVKHNS
jgi:hypothetical protein